MITPPTDVQRELAAIAAQMLGIETLDERGRDALDFHQVGVRGLKDALMAAFHLGEEHARRDVIVSEIGEDLEINEIKRRCTGAGDGAWVRGTLNGHRFHALVWSAHADHAEWEIGESRITKLWVKRIADKAVVFSWDRGMDVPAQDATAQAIVGFLCEGVADLAYGGEGVRS